MGKELDLDDAVAGHPVAEKELLRLRKNSIRYQAIRQDHEGKFLPDIAMYAGRALDDYIDDSLSRMLDAADDIGPNVKLTGPERIE